MRDDGFYKLIEQHQGEKAKDSVKEEGDKGE